MLPRPLRRLAPGRVATLLALTLAAPGTAQAPCASLVRDINQRVGNNPGSLPIGPKVELGGWVFFAATTQALGTELYRCTAAPGSVQLVADIRPGLFGSDPTQLTVLAGKLWFVADDGAHGDELWVSDGTTAGTRMVMDIDPRTDHPTLRPHRWLTELSGRVYFAADDGARGTELWSTDGTLSGTAIVADLRAGAASSQPRALCVLQGSGGPFLLFAADDGVLGSELWRSDGTAAGTTLVRDIAQGSQSSDLRYLTPFAGRAVFAAFENATGVELWSTDGTAAGTSLVIDLVAVGSGSPRPPDNTYVGGVGESFFAHAGLLYFTAAASFGRGLWRTDGTAGGTVQLGTGLFFEFTAAWMAGLGPHAYFVGGVTNGATGIELWRTDGTPAGTVLLVDLRPGAASSTPSWLTTSGSRLLFAANDGANGLELWSSDGTAAGTRLALDIRPGASGSDVRATIDLGGQVIFAADDSTHGMELWLSDGTPAGTLLLQDIDPGNGTTDPAGIDELVDVAGIAYFEATDGALGAELWRTDGTPAGTRMVKDIRPGIASAGVYRATAFGGRLVFLADDGVHGGEPWVSDGSTAGTQILADTVPGSTSGFFYAPVEMAGWLYFGTSAQLWRTDGTPAGTQMVTGSTPMWASARLGDRIVFQGKDPANYIEPWVTDGTAAGTFLLADIHPGNSLIVNCTSPVATDTFVLFGAIDATGQQNLWRTDGTSAGTVKVTPAVTAYGFAVRLGQRVVFRGNDGHPWVSDGTSANTFRLQPVVMLNAASVAFGDELVFAADDGVHGYEPWITDGTPAGTRPIADLEPGPGSGFGGAALASGSRYVWLAARRPDVGYELWRSDGTAAGTVLACDVWPGVGYGVTGKMLLSRGALLLEADDGRGSGKELFSFFPGASAQALGVGCARTTRTPDLRATDPVLGGSSTWTALGTPGIPVGYFAAGALPPALLDLGSGCRIHAGLPWILIGFVPDAQGRGSVSVPVPNDAALVAGRLVTQAVFGPTPTPPLGLDLSQGVLLTLGR